MGNTSLEDLFASTTPEQRLMILRSEISTPIEIIQGYTGLIKKHASNTGDQELIEFVEKIEQAAEYLKLLRNAIR